MLRVGLPIHIEGELNEGAETLLARAQLVLGALALGDVAHQGKGQPTVAVPEFPDAYLDREECTVLSPVPTLIGQGSACTQTLTDPLQHLGCQIRTEFEWRHPDQLVASITQTFAGLAVPLQHLGCQIRTEF